jgi:hypothetical protein
MRVIELTTKNILLLCVGLSVVFVIAIIDPLLLVGLVVGFGAGAFCFKRYPEKFKLFTRENKDKARIKELEDKIALLEAKIK